MLPSTGYIVFAWLCTGLLQLPLLINRLYVGRQNQERSRSRSIWLWSDIFVTTAWIFNVAAIAVDTVMYCHGVLIDDISGLSTAEQVFAYKGYWAGAVMYWIPFWCIKIAILLFYLELVPVCLRKIRFAVYVCFFLVAAGFIYNELNMFLMCRPLKLQWDVKSGYGEDVCKDSYTAAIAVGWHMCTDIYVYLIPFFLINKIHIPSKSQKVTTFFIFASGFLCVLASIPTFLSYLVPALYDPFMWAFYTGVVEETTAITVACLPALRVSVVRWHHNRFRKSEETKRSQESRTRTDAVGVIEVERDVLTTNDLRTQLEKSVETTTAGSGTGPMDHGLYIEQISLGGSQTGMESSIKGPKEDV